MFRPGPLERLDDAVRHQGIGSLFSSRHGGGGMKRSLARSMSLSVLAVLTGSFSALMGTDAPWYVFLVVGGIIGVSTSFFSDTLEDKA